MWVEFYANFANSDQKVMLQYLYKKLCSKREPWRDKDSTHFS